MLWGVWLSYIFNLVIKFILFSFYPESPSSCFGPVIFRIRIIAVNNKKMNIILIIYKNHKWLVELKSELRRTLKSKNFMNSSELISKSSLLISLTSDLTKSNKSEKPSDLSTVPSSSPKTYSSFLSQTLIKKIIKLRVEGVQG